jgi:outer membrane protein TolC
VQQVEKQIRLEIDNALIALEQARATAAAAQQERTYQDQAVAAEMDRLGVGVSTTYGVSVRDVLDDGAPAPRRSPADR